MFWDSYVTLAGWFISLQASFTSSTMALDRVRELERRQPEPSPTRFTMPAVKTVYDDSFAQAAYVYSLIESKVVMDGAQ